MHVPNARRPERHDTETSGFSADSIGVDSLTVKLVRPGEEPLDRGAVWVCDDLVSSAESLTSVAA